MLRVIELYEVPGFVDFSTGNIDFEGSVHVRQGIRDRFEVKATGSIIVDGLVEGATIHCGGDFTAHQGMVGKERGLLFVKGNADVGYLNNVKAEIIGNLTVRRELMNCDLVIGKSLNCKHG